jgi:GTP-binding protein EngB required for normal cell division
MSAESKGGPGQGVEYSSSGSSEYVDVKEDTKPFLPDTNISLGHRILSHSNQQNGGHDERSNRGLCQDWQLDPGTGQLTGMLRPEGQPPPPPPKSPSIYQVRVIHPLSHINAKKTSRQMQTSKPRRNVVIFGESGSGKSSVINAIAQQTVSVISGDAAGCTFRYQSHSVEISGQTFVLFDTAGLDEATVGTVPAAKAEEDLKNLLRALRGTSDGISLLIYCVRSMRVHRAQTRNYHIFYSAICRKKVPIVVVITGLENQEPTMDSWWDTNNAQIEQCGMHFDDHACVTTIRDDPSTQGVFTERITESSELLRRLLLKNGSQWVADESWFKLSSADVRNLISYRQSERSSPPTLIICDSSQREEVEIACCINGVVQIQVANIGGVAYQVYHVSEPEFKLTSSVEGRPEADLLIYYASKDEQRAAHQKFASFCAVHRGNMIPVIVVVKGLNDSTAAHQWVERHIIGNYQGSGRPISTFAPAKNLNDHLTKQKAEEELRALIKRSCLIRTEGKGGGVRGSFVKLLGRWLPARTDGYV